MPTKDIMELSLIQKLWQTLPIGQILVLSFISYHIGLAVYRLYFHPLANIPGPRIAAITKLWEIKQNVWLKGHLIIEIKKLHEQYGPIVRISPNGVHISDPDVYEQIYKVGSQFTKDPTVYNIAFGPPTFFTEPSIVDHRIGREPIAQFFSRRVVLSSMQHLVWGEVDKLAGRFQEFLQKDQPACTHAAFRAVTTDVITNVAWGVDEELVLADDFSFDTHEKIYNVLSTFWTRSYFPAFTRLISAIPERYVKLLDENIGKFLEMIELCRQQVIRIKETTSKDEYKHEESPRTVFHALLDENVVIKGKRTDGLEALTGIGVILYFAGVETTANTLTRITYHLLNNRDIVERLQQELDAAFPDRNEKMDLAKVESLPYLAAVIQEGLRISFGVGTRLPRIVPASGFKYNGFFIPPGAQIGMSSYSMHTEESIFPDAFTFVPDRWLGPDAKELDKYLVTFSKGSRGCLGKNLALCELYLTLAMMFRRFDFSNFETTDWDMEVKHDFFSVYANMEGKRARVKVTAARP